MSGADHRILQLGLADFKDPTGRDIVERCQPFREWVDASSEAGVFQFLRHHTSAPGLTSEVVGWGGQRYRGINLASQDYLGLARHPAIIAAATRALVTHGAHSAGSEPMGGGIGEGKALEADLSAFLGNREVVLFPTGWSAGYGSIQALVRPYDAVVMDALSHNCLQHGAAASTGDAHLFAHNDMTSLRRRLGRIREAHPSRAILVVTESLFSMDSDAPDFEGLVRACRDAGAALLVDVAHDLGVLGTQGRGLLWESGCQDEVDFLMGSFSKTFASIGGFFAARERGSTYYVRGFSGSYTFSNYLIPPQIAAIRAALTVVNSTEGERLRHAALANAAVLRQALQDEGMTVSGRLSSLVLPLIGRESVARLAYRSCLERGVILNNIEYPACRRGAARFRLQVTPSHAPDELRAAAHTIAGCVREARALLDEGTDGRLD